MPISLHPQPIYISLLFIATALTTAYLFYVASRKSKLVLMILMTILTAEALAGMSGFFLDTSGFPPRIGLVILLPLLMIGWLFFSKTGQRFLNRLDQEKLTLLHTVRVVVEITLFLLFTYKNVPELMTFAGRNFDILAGLTAPLIYYFGYKKKVLSNGIKIGWNVIAIGLLLFIVVNALLSIPTSFQMFGLHQPNIAILFFPFIWLPGFIVPIVLLSHLATIRLLLHPEKEFHYSTNVKKRSKSKHKKRRR